MSPRFHAHKYTVILLISVTVFCLAFSGNGSHKDRVASFYDNRLDELSRELIKFKTIAHSGAGKQPLINSFLACRTAYKKVEFLVDVFEPFRCRQFNGPDLVKIEEENPTDSIMPHGLQVIEGCLYANSIECVKLNKEIDLLIKNTKRLREDPDRIYYFRDDKIFQGARIGLYRIISMGVTGFDVPSSYHALPETRAVLSGIHTVVSYYKKDMGDSLYNKGDTLFRKADQYLAGHNNFNTFDRLYFIREHVDGLSEWLTACVKRLGFINHNELNPLNPYAAYLFAPDIMNLDFFSPDKKFRVTRERIALGKRLFYDTRLSGDGSRSCGSCHQPSKGFADGLAKPTNMNGSKELLRNTPTLWNVALQTRQFFDSRTERLENQLSAVVHNTDEMNGSLENSVPRLLADKSYNDAFREAYPGDKEYISHYNIANAISSYVRALISLNSRFDRYMRHQCDSLGAAEKNGFNLFMGKAKCGTCHYAPVFNGLTPPLYQETESEILAVPATDEKVSVLDADPGKAKYTKVSLHEHAFKTPTIRNVALTTPYMHNGVFKTLDDVVSFYNDGGGAGRGIHLAAQTLPTDKLNLSKKEMKDIVAFLHTLTDTSGASFMLPGSGKADP